MVHIKITKTNSSTDMNVQIRGDNDMYSSDEDTNDMRIDSDTEEDTYDALITGCIICSKIVVVTRMNPYVVGHAKQFPFSDETRFLPVYCTPCVNSSFGFGRDARVSLRMIMDSDVYKKACDNISLGRSLKINTFRSMVIVRKAFSVLSRVSASDYISTLTSKTRMGLKEGTNLDMEFFECPKLFFDKDRTMDADDDSGTDMDD